MARPVDMTKKIEELRIALQKYNGIPSQTVDKAAHANIKYYIKRYSDNPEIKALIEEYGLSYTKRDDYETHLEKIKTALAEIGRMPSSSKDKTLYQNVKYFFKRYENKSEVERLKWVYAFGCFPLPNTQYGSKPDPEYVYDSWEGRSYMSNNYFEWQDNVSYEYIEYVFKHYQELPGHETKPMVRLKKKISHWERYNIDVRKSESTQLYNFLQRMIDIGCEDDLIKQAYYSFKFDTPEVQAQVERMLIENGACAIHYIAQTAMLESTLSDRFVYYYYYILMNDRKEERRKMPLASLYSGVVPYRVLRIHYRDYYKCNVDKIRESAKAHYRDWRENRPETLEEWKYYGQSEFFDNKEEFFGAHIIGEYDSSIDWTTTYIEKRMQKGRPYFRFYVGIYRYLDYCLYLLENGYTLKDEDIIKYLGTETLANDEKLTDEDLLVYIEMLKYLPNCFIDANGGYYLQEERCILLCITKPVITYQLNKNTTIIARNALRLVEDSLEEIVLNNKLIGNNAKFEKCKNLKKIVVPPYCEEEYLKLFTKYDTTKFFDLSDHRIQYSAIIEENKLLYVPYTETYTVPAYVEEIDKDAFRHSGIKHLTISGGVKKIKESLFWCDNDLEEITILEGVEELWGNIFGNCINLKKVTLPQSLTHLYNCFEGCSSLRYINLENIIYIGNKTFRRCSSLETISIEKHLRVLGDNAFEDCINLKHVEFKDGIDEISGAFEYCKNLETIIFRGQYKSFGYCSKNLGIYKCEKLKAIYVQAEFMDLFKEHFSSEYHHLLKETY